MRTVLVLVLVLVLAPRARAEDEAAIASATNGILELLKRDDLGAAMDRATTFATTLESPAPQEPGTRRLGLVLAVARAARFAKDRTGEEASVKRALAAAGERARPEDLGFLRSVASSSTRAAPYARALARDACSRIDASTESRTLVAFLRGDDADARRRAAAAIGDRLAQLRSKVAAGGELDAIEQAELADPLLIATLVEDLASPRQGADALAHDLAASAAASSLHALALVEAPAIPALEAAKRRGLTGAGEALTAIRQAAEERLQRHPSSTWSSARGAMPRILPDAVPCTGCQKPLPEGARFCPACGSSAPGVPCPRCGEAVLGDICPRCGGASSAKVASRTCEKCGEASGASDRFCRRCGATLAAEVKPK